MRSRPCCFVFLVIILLGADDPKVILRSLLPKEEFAPDAQYEAKAGERRSIEVDETPAALKLETLQEYMKALSARDDVGLKAILETGTVVKTAKGDKVIVLKVFRPDRVYRSLPIGTNLQDVARAMQEDLLHPGRDPAIYPIEVRFIDGKLKDKAALVPETSIIPIVTKPAPRGFVVRTPGEIAGSFEMFVRPKLEERRGQKLPDPTIRATTLLRAAQRLQERREDVGAVGAYWFVMTDYPTLPQAVTAAQRLDAMGFYRDAKGDYVLDPSRRKNRRR